MKIASWNVNSLNVRLPHLQLWLQDFVPDVVGLQETKLEDHKFPEDALLAAGIVARQALLRAQIDAIAADLEGEAA